MVVRNHRGPVCRVGAVETLRIRILGRTGLLSVGNVTVRAYNPYQSVDIHRASAVDEVTTFPWVIVRPIMREYDADDPMYI